MQLTKNPLDAHLLRSLCVLLSERSVTRAAAKLQLSQPATSLMLKRLRVIFGDQLLVRGRDGMQPTERAIGLHASALKALTEIDNLLIGPGRFDPAISTQTFTIALPDYIVPTYLARAVAEFRRLAPGARLEVRSLSPDFDFETALSTGTIDVVISNWPSPPPYLRSSPLFDDEIVSLVDHKHAYGHRRPTLKEFLAADHIAPTPYSAAHRGVVETTLTRLRLTRERRVVVSYFSMAPFMLVGTDLVFTTSRHFAEYYASILPLKIISPPVRFPRMRFYQLWHDRAHLSPPHRWFRKVLSLRNPTGRRAGS